MGVAPHTVCLLLLSVAACQAQLVYPLAGQEIGANGIKSVPSNGLSASPRLDIRVSALLDRVLAFDIMENTYDGTSIYATRLLTCFATWEASLALVGPPSSNCRQCTTLPLAAVWWVVLTWEDSSAAQAVAERTGTVMQSRSEDCQRPCDSNNLPSAGTFEQTNLLNNVCSVLLPRAHRRCQPTGRANRCANHRCDQLNRKQKRKCP